MDNIPVQEVYTRNGRTRYYTDSANEVFNPQNNTENKKADFSFLSAENIGKSIAEKQRASDDFKERYLIELDDTQRGLLNVMLEHSEDPEEQMYKFATAQKYAEHFNIPFNFAYENLDDINRNWLGAGIEAHKGNFRAVADSFEIGVNTLRMSTAGRDLMKAEESGDERDIQAALEYLKTLEDESAQLQDKIPRNWLVNLLKLGANTVPYSAAVLGPSLAASAVNPLFGSAVGFGVSAELQTGLEYWDLRKMGVKKEIARNVAVLSGGLQAVVETALGSVAGATGRGLGADKITSKLLTRLNAKGVFGKLGKSLLFYGANIAEEGFEEAIQEFVSASGKELAAVLQGEGVETDTAIEIAENMWESFKGGIAGSLVLGVPGAIKYGRLNIQEAKVLQKAAIVTPSETAFINENKDSIVFEGMSEEDTEQELHSIFEAQKNAREAFQKSKINDYDQWLSADARIEGEAVIDDEGNTVYETDETGKVIYETDEQGEVHKKVKRYGAQADVVRHKDRLYISEGKRTEYASGIVKGEYIAGDPTRETDDNDYGHIYYTYNPDSNTVRITKLEMTSNRYDDIIKEFVRDFGEQFAGSRIKWDAKGETLQKIKEELIAENPRGKESGLQYFTDDISSDAERSRIKLHDKLKEYMPNLNETERHMAVALFEALAQGAGMDMHSYLDTYYETAVFTKTAPEGMAQLAAQQDIDTQTIKGATDFKGLEGDIKALVYVSEKSDFSTLVHEAAHVARRTMQGALLQQAEKAFGVTDGIWTREAEERFAKGFEQYLREGKAPSAELKNIFQKAAEFLSRIYKSLKELVHINDDIRAVYDELLGVQGSALQQAEKNIQEAERAKKAKQNTSGKYASAESYEQNKVIETAEDKALDNAALKDKYMVYAKERFQGNSYHNIDTDTDIRVSRDILDEWQSKTKSREQILSMQALDKLIESAVETHITQDRENRVDIQQVKYFETGLSVGDKTYKAHLTARKVQDNTTKAYHYYLEDISLEDMVLDRIKEEAALRIDALREGRNVPLLHGLSMNTIAQQDEAVNSEKTVYEQAQDAYDEAGKAVQKVKPLSDEELKDMLFQAEPTEKETQETEAVRAQYEGTDKWLKAPNGKDTQLSEKQWVQVRTDSFKKWFGDWENDPENASKVIDENGEPLVVYHGTAHTFNTFSTPLNMERIFLTRNKEFAGKYGNIAMPLFVNAKDVLSVDYKGKDAFDDITIQGKKLESIEEAAEYARENGYNALFAAHVADSGTFSSEIDINDEVIVFNPNQIKSAVDNKGTFDSANDNIYFQVEEIAAATEEQLKDMLFQTKPTAEETQETEAVRKRYEGTDKWLKAPNGKDTQLSERQWLQVRTGSFKKWFGDWENDPDEASKVIDKNGEPLVVSHSTKYVFDTFIYKQKTDAGWLGAGFYFFGDRSLDGQYGKNVMECFLNIREPYFASYKESEELAETNDNDVSQEFTKMLKSEYDADGVYFDENLNQEWVAFEANQIKSAVDNKGTFDSANDNIYFQTEADFYEESTQAINKEVLEHDVEKIVLGKDPMEFYSLIYSDSEQRALYDKAFREAISGELEEALQKDIKDESVKNDTFMKMLLHNKDALKEFLKQFIAAESAAHDHLMPHDAFIAHGGRFGELAYWITQGKPFTEKQYKRALGIIEDDVGTYRNIFARLNGYEALKSMSKEEKAWTKAYSEAVFSGKVKNAEVQSAERFRARNRSETQDALFLAEMDDDAKFNAFLQRAAQIYFFNFDAFQAQDAEDARERDRIQAQKERIDTLMRNMAWKSQLINSYHGKELSAHAVKNIRGQLNNAVRTYRDLYADIMDRRDMRVKDADSTDEIIRTKLRSRKQSSVVLDELKLENMSAKEKEVLIQALDNEETEENIRKGFITLADVEKIENLIKAKNKNIKSLELKIKDLQDSRSDNLSTIAKLEQDIRDERTARRVLADTVRARDAALKAVMKRINLKACNVDEAQSIASVQWYLSKNVQRALNATVDKAEPVIREAYTLWQTSAEYREKLTRMIGRKRDWGKLRALLNNEHKAVADWSSDDRKLAMRLIPGRSKFYSLGLDAQTEKNFLDMKTAALGSAEIARQATEVLGETLIARLKHRPLKQWTVDELIELAQRIDEVYQAGRKKYVAKKAALQAEAEAIRTAGIQAFRGAKDLRGKDIFKEIPGAWSEDEKKKTGGIPALLRTAKYTAMRSYAFMEMLDGGRQGTLYDLFEYEQRECNALFKQNTNKRIDSFYEFLQKNKLDLSELDKTVVFDDFYRDINDPFAKGKSLTLTVKEVLGAYLASFDEKSRAAVQYGNFAEQKERDFAQKGDGETSLDVLSEERLHRVFWKAEELLSQDERLRGLVQLLQKEYKEEGRRLQQHDREVNNKITEIREHYFPMQRLDVSGEEDARQTQKKIQGEFATGTRHGVSKGQTKERIDISNKHQKPIKLDIISTYLHSVEANERLFAYDKYAQKLNRVVKGYGSERFIKDLETTYGREAVSYLNKQVNTIIDPTAGRVYSSADKVIRMLRGNKAAAYLGFKLSSIIKQGITSPAPFMQYVNPVNYTKAAIDWTIHHDEMKKFVYERSMLMKNRSFDMMQAITDELAKNAKTKAGKAITKAQRLGMGGLEWIDRTCVAPGWIAAYRKEKARLEKRNAELSKPLSDNEIDIQSSRYADDVLVRTQPSGRAEELAPLFREGGEALRMLLQFQSSLNVIYNNIRHDLPNAIRNKQYRRAAGIITGYALAGLMTGAITEGFSGDDDDEASDKVRRGIYYAFTQYTDSVPIISGIVDSVAEKVITGKTRYRGTGGMFATVEKLAQGTAALSDADIAKAAQKYAEAAGLTLGLPTSGTKEALYAAEQIFSGEVPSALWGRR